MRKLGELKLNENVTVLSEQEMKKVRGGYNIGGYCYPDEKLFQCLVFVYGGNSYSGVACGFDEIDAKKRVETTLLAQGMAPGGDVNVACNPTYS